MSGTISFPYYPSSNRTQGTFADVDGSKANTALVQQRALIMGQMLTGIAAPNVPMLITSLPQAGMLWGVGSMIYQEVEQYLKTDTFGELWGVGLTDPAGTTAGGLIALAGTATAAGTVSLYVGGKLLATPVYVGDTANVVLNRLLTVVLPLAPRMAAALGFATGTTVNVTSVHAGILGNDIDLRTNYLGTLGGEAPVPGLTITLTPLTGGTGVPLLSAALAALGDVTYDFICCPYTDAASLITLDAFFNFQVGRWSWQSMLYGGYFTAARGTPGTLVTLGQSRNGPNGSCLGFFDSPDPCWVVAADYTASCAVSLRQDPNVPLQNIVMNFQAPPRTSGFIRSIRNTLLYDGISTYTVNRAGQVILERACTFYQLNTAGVPDNSYLDVETMFGLMQLIRDWKAEMTRLFPQFKLLQDGNAIPAGDRATTAQIIRASTNAWYRTEVAAGRAQSPDVFLSRLVAQNAGNGLVKELLPFVLPNQLRQIAGLVQFTKP